MNIAYRCILQYNSDISKIRKFFESDDTLYVLAGKAGITFQMVTADGSCMCVARIHACDIYQLHVREIRTVKVKTQVVEDGKIVEKEVEEPSPDDTWRHGGIYRCFQAASFLNFIKPRETDDNLRIEIDDDASIMVLSIISGSNVKRTVSIPLTMPTSASIPPTLTDATVVLQVNEFKKLCSEFARCGSETHVEAQKSAIRMIAGNNTITLGSWDESGDVDKYFLERTAFGRATHINIGNTKRSLAGIYSVPKYPLVFKVKLGIVDFLLCAKKMVSL